jgi:hypothetical protein
MKHRITWKTSHVLRILQSGHLVSFLYEMEYRFARQLPQYMNMDNTHITEEKTQRCSKQYWQNILHFLHSVHFDIIFFFKLDQQNTRIFNVLITKLLHFSALTGPSSGTAVVQNKRRAILSSPTYGTVVRSSMCDLRGEYVPRICKILNCKQLNYKNPTAYKI